MQPGIFHFAPIEHIVHGVPAAQALRQEAERLDARRVFLLVSRTLNQTTDEIDKVRQALGNRYVGTFDGMRPHTPRDAVIAAAEQARGLEADLIVTFGGGSATDAGKMVQLCLRHDVVDIDGLDAFRVLTRADGSRHAPEYDGPTVRQIAVPTTLSAGEYHGFASCTDTRVNAKHTYIHAGLVPRVTILDPRATLHTPMQTWLSTGVRAIDHAVESICAEFPNTVCDGYSLQSLRLLKRYLPRVLNDPSDLEARQECQFAAWLSMAGTSQLGVQKGLSHALGRSLGGTCDVPHGLTSCFTLPAALRFNRVVNADRQALVAEALGHPGSDVADVLERFIAELGLPSRLAQVGVYAGRFALIAENAMSDPHLHANPRKVRDPRELVDLLETVA
jgi:maleylacetate reductase